MIGDAPEAWAAAGFAVEESTVTIANTALVLAGTGRGRGILEAHVEGIGRDVDGMPFAARTDAAAAVSPAASPAGEHPNGIVDLDHLVAMSPDMDRTIAALVDAGLDHRRSRTFAAGEHIRRQAFFWLGDVILELAGDDGAHDPGPASLWGLAFTSHDLTATAGRLGELLGAPKPAVQPAREIATLRTGELDISVPIVVMSPQP